MTDQTSDANQNLDDIERLRGRTLQAVAVLNRATHQKVAPDELEEALAAVRADLELLRADPQGQGARPGADELVKLLAELVDLFDRHITTMRNATALRAAGGYVELLLDRRNRALQSIAEASAETTVLEGITVLCDANGYISSVRIDDHTLSQHSHAVLGRVIAQALQTAHDRTVAAVRAQFATAMDETDVSAPTNTAHRGAGVVKIFGGGQLAISVDDHGRPTACQIGPEAAAWELPVLSDRIAKLCRIAQLEAKIELFRAHNEDRDSLSVGPTAAELDQCRAALR